MIYYTENQIDDLRTVIGAKDAEIARLRDALEWMLETVDSKSYSVSRMFAAKDKARAALAQVAEVGK